MWVVLKTLTPCRGSAEHPWSSESCPSPHSPGNCWVLEKKKSRTMSHTNCADSRADSVEQMGWVRCVCKGTDSLPLWPGSVGSHTALVRQRSQGKPFLYSVWTWRCLSETCVIIDIWRLTNSSCSPGDCRTVRSHSPLPGSRCTRKSEMWHLLFSPDKHII